MLRTFALAALACVAAAPTALAGVGDKVDYKFRQAPVNAMGVAGFADLRGKPVLVDFWGTR
ncbi:MAG: hypothetical protein NTY35_09785 [Planctomycetota bacterium]|nr:hypothetical protein [Planctomycetota bacterium]